MDHWPQMRGYSLLVTSMKETVQKGIQNSNNSTEVK